jgi:hypothetical protein
VLITNEEIVKCSKERFILLNKLNIFHEHNRRAECAGVAARLRRRVRLGKRVISSFGSEFVMWHFQVSNHSRETNGRDGIQRPQQPTAKVRRTAG